MCGKREAIVCGTTRPLSSRRCFLSIFLSFYYDKRGDYVWYDETAVLKEFFLVTFVLKEAFFSSFLVVLCCTIKCQAILCSAVLCSTVLCSTVLCSTILCGTMARVSFS